MARFLETPRTIACAVCARPAELEVHRFVVGVMDGNGNSPHPTKVWTIAAPLRFKASQDGLRCERPYCSPECSLLDQLSSTPLSARIP